MIFGNPTDVALEIFLERTVDQWIYGRFLLWIGGRSVGNGEDVADLKGCVNWLSDFLEKPKDRSEPDLMMASKNEVWQKIVEPCFEEIPADDRFGNLFSRFHLSHLGMSAFNNVTLVLIDDGKKFERCLWQQNEEDVMDFMASRGSLEASAKEAVLWFQSQDAYQLLNCHRKRQVSGLNNRTSSIDSETTD